MKNKTIVFNILSQNPSMSASQLQKRALEAGLQLSALAAYRGLRSFRESEGKLEQSEARCMRLVSSILQNAPEGDHLTAADILAKAAEGDSALHKATVYRVLARLSSIGLVLASDRGRQRFYEWKREETHHGHLTCMRCGATVEFHQEYLDEVANQICNRLGYEFHDIEFVVRSLCPECR